MSETKVERAYRLYFTLLGLSGWLVIVYGFLAGDITWGPMIRCLFP